VPPTIEAKRRTAREPAIVTSARVESEREVLVALITSATMVLFTESAADAETRAATNLLRSHYTRATKIPGGIA
jgi:hypothetical protein